MKPCCTDHYGECGGQAGGRDSAAAEVMEETGGKKGKKSGRKGDNRGRKGEKEKKKRGKKRLPGPKETGKGVEWPYFKGSCRHARTVAGFGLHF